MWILTFGFIDNKSSQPGYCIVFYRLLVSYLLRICFSEFPRHAAINPPEGEVLKFQCCLPAQPSLSQSSVKRESSSKDRAAQDPASMMAQPASH